MSLRAYLNLMIIATFLAGAAWVSVLLYIDPFESGTVGLILFYSTLFFTLVGIFTSLGFQLRRKLLNNELLYVLVGLSFRQAVWFSLIIIGLLLMQSFRIINWWDAILLIISVFLLEAYFLAD